MIDHHHVSLFGPVECTCTEQEAENLALITAYRAARVADRKRFFAPGYRRHRAAFQHIGDINGVHHHGDDAMADRRNVVLDMTAKADKVWAIWSVVGHHTGDWYGLAATGRPVDVVEAGLWRVEDGLIAEAWFFGDELALLQQLDLFPGIGST
jgi:predicted ester cyclase